MSLEQIVRPFAAPQSLVSRRIIPATTQRPVETAGARWGKAGELPVPQETDEPGPAPQHSFNTRPREVDLTHKETSRETEQIKIEQTDNPDNFVVVERTKSMAFSQAAPPAVLAKKEAGITAYRASAPALAGTQGTTSGFTSGATAQVPADSELGRQIQRGEVEYITNGKNVYRFNPPAAAGAP